MEAGSKEYVIVNAILYRSLDARIHSFHDKALKVPAEYRQQIFHMAQNNMFSSHSRVKSTTDRIAFNFFGPELAKSVKQYVQSCDFCQRRSINRIADRQPLRPVRLKGQPFDVHRCDGARIEQNAKREKICSDYGTLCS